MQRRSSSAIWSHKTRKKTSINKLIREASQSTEPIYISKYYKSYKNQLHNYLCKDIKSKLGDKLLEQESQETHQSCCHCGCNSGDDDDCGDEESGDAA